MPATPSFLGRRPASKVSSLTKRATKSRNTQPELALRIALRARGLRYRIHYNLLGNPDIAFPAQRVAVFCDGDFWHGRNWSRLRRSLLRGANPDYWIPKIQANRARDRRVSNQLARMGWQVIRMWERDISSDPSSAAAHVITVLRSSRRVR
jgi:DNA mismatch endonuclease (patch repair protein)